MTTRGDRRRKTKKMRECPSIYLSIYLHGQHWTHLSIHFSIYSLLLRFPKLFCLFIQLRQSVYPSVCTSKKATSLGIHTCLSVHVFSYSTISIYPIITSPRYSYTDSSFYLLSCSILSINLSVYPAIYSSPVNLSINLWIHTSAYLPIYHCINYP